MALRYNVLITVWISLGYNLSKTTHAWHLLTLLYEWEQFLIDLPLVTFTCDIQGLQLQRFIQYTSLS